MNVKKPIRIAAASDQPIYLKGMVSVLLSIPGVQFVGQAASPQEIIQLCQISAPDLVLLDFRQELEPLRGLATQLHDQWPAMIVLLLVGFEDENLLSENFGREPVFYLSRDLTEEEFNAALAQIQVLHQNAPKPQEAEPALFRHQVQDGFGEDEQSHSAPKTRIFHTRDDDVVSRELVMAGKIQADILPERVPTIPGWEIAARLIPARETSGDFYDFIPFAARKLGFVVADVTDKGMGAALFMALASTLIRTYASRFPTLPAFTLSAVSDRILSDTRGNMFVTAFYGILEPHTGRFVYANAGHPPGFIITTRKGHESIEFLRPTGMALGVSEQAQWKQKNYRLEPGCLLIFYTDGITEAQSPQGEFFGEEHLLDVVLSKTDCPAAEILETLLQEVQRFVGDVPRQDDIALIVIRRDR